MDMLEMRGQVRGMAVDICEILDLVEKGFMEHKTEFLTAAIEKEHKVNEKEKALTSQIVDISRSAKDRKALVAMAQAIEMLERMGDEAAGLIERIEIKIAEKLLFSEEGVQQFNETYNAMKRSAHMMRDFFDHPDEGLKKNIIDNGFHVKDLVERYRKEHADRFVRGVCTPLGANMYFDMLDFTGNLARHSSNVVKLLGQ